MSYYDVVLASPSLITTTEIARTRPVGEEAQPDSARGAGAVPPVRLFLYARFAEQGYTSQDARVRGQDPHPHVLDRKDACSSTTY